MANGKKRRIEILWKLGMGEDFDVEFQRGKNGDVDVEHYRWETGGDPRDFINKLNALANNEKRWRYEMGLHAKKIGLSKDEVDQVFAGRQRCVHCDELAPNSFPGVVCPKCDRYMDGSDMTEAALVLAGMCEATGWKKPAQRVAGKTAAAPGKTASIPSQWMAAAKLAFGAADGWLYKHDFGDIQEIWIIGSHAEGSAGPQSDIDILMVGDDFDQAEDERIGEFEDGKLSGLMACDVQVSKRCGHPDIILSSSGPWPNQKAVKVYTLKDGWIKK